MKNRFERVTLFPPYPNEFNADNEEKQKRTSWNEKKKRGIQHRVIKIKSERVAWKTSPGSCDTNSLTFNSPARLTFFLPLFQRLSKKRMKKKK